jgi:hypothetical protein
MNRAVNQFAVELINIDVYPVAIGFLPEYDIYRNYRNAQLLRQVIRDVGTAVSYNPNCRTPSPNSS